MLYEHIHKKNSQYFHTQDNKFLLVNIFQNIILYTNIYIFLLCSLCRKLYTCLHKKNQRLRYHTFCFSADGVKLPSSVLKGPRRYDKKKKKTITTHKQVGERHDGKHSSDSETVGELQCCSLKGNMIIKEYVRYNELQLQLINTLSAKIYTKEED